MTIKPQIQAKILHISIIVLLLLSIIFLSVGYSIAETQGMTRYRDFKKSTRVLRFEIFFL